MTESLSYYAKLLKISPFSYRCHRRRQ